jgi:hypothetical protein
VESVKPENGELLGGAIAFNVVGFVGDKDDRLTAAAQQLRHLGVARVRTSGCIYKEQDQVGGINCDARLVLDPNLNRIADRGLHAPCVDHTEAHPIPLNDADQAIASGAGTIFNDCTSLANEAIEEGALPNVWSPNQRHEWQATG